MSNKFILVLVLFCSIYLSFTLIFSQNGSKMLQNDQKFKKEYEAYSFDYPIGKPNGKGYYNAQKFGDNNHLGEDWNGVGGGNTDYGDSIFSIANGQVTFAKDIKGGWGQVIRIKHKYKGKFYESVYAHCSKMNVIKGDWIKIGTHIGNIGDCNGKYKAHLHFELRDSLNLTIGGGYSPNKTGYINPTNFINRN